MKAFASGSRAGLANRVWGAFAVMAIVLAGCSAPAPNSAPAAQTPAQAPAQEPAAPAAPAATEASVAEAPAAPAPAGTPKYGGTWRFAAEMDVATLDSAEAGNYEDWWSAGHLLYNQLFTVDRDGKLQPALASDWPKVSEDGKVLTIPLRPGVKFHNGREMTADDVKFTFERISTVGWCGAYMANIVGYEDIKSGKTQELSGVKVVDPLIIEVTLKQPNSTFLYELNNSCAGIVPKQEVIDAGADWGTKVVIGTGPFMFKEWKTGEKVTYVRNSDYWKKGLPYLDQVEIFLNVAAPTAFLRWESQEVEFTYSGTAADMARVLADSQLKERLLVRDGPNFAYFQINVNAKPFDDPNVRKAVLMVLDKRAYAQKNGPFSTPADSFYGPVMPQYDPNFKGVPYDVELAKKMMADAGYADGIKGVAIYSGGTGKDVGELVQADLKKIGIEAELLTGDFGVVKERWDAGEIIMRGFGGAPGFPDAAGLMDRWICPNFAAGETLAPGQWCDERINELYEKTKPMKLEDPERNRIFAEIMDIVVNQGLATANLWFNKTATLSQPYVKNLVASPVYLLPVLDEAWLDK